ncbi:MAG: tail fiber domain-containing protein, partial [Candidatus Kapaibacteriota bacterium]
SWTNASDARYKHDIADLPFGLDFILQLKPRQYVYNNSSDGKITMGFVAQEVQEVMKHYNMLDKYNLVKIMEKDFLGLNTTEIIPILVKAVQEQQKLIEKMKAETVGLSEENARLKEESERFKETTQQQINQLQAELESIKKTLVNTGVFGEAK